MPRGCCTFCCGLSALLATRAQRLVKNFGTNSSTAVNRFPHCLAVFERHDSIEGSFDEESQGMLEVTPEPNLIIPFQGDSATSVASAFAALAALCRVIAAASELMTLMPGNEHQV
jgi:hypothetical protein